VYTRTDLQKAADAAALAGSQDLPNATTATSSANIYVGLNSKSATTASVAITTISAPNDTIQVTATRHIDYFFLKVLGLSGTDVSATAKAAMGFKRNVTGYSWQNSAPFVVWGGGQQNPVAADAGCPYHTCAGKSYEFLGSQWMNDSGKPTAPSWNVDSSGQNFKGDIDHGSSTAVVQIGDTVTPGGIGNATAPTPGTIIVLPIIDNASGNSNAISIHVVAWVVMQVNADCVKSKCKGTVLSPATTTPPPGWSSSGSVQPPAGLTYQATSSARLTQ
jgi:hypothetical protein